MRKRRHKDSAGLPFIAAVALSFVTSVASGQESSRDGEVASLAAAIEEARASPFHVASASPGQTGPSLVGACCATLAGVANRPWASSLEVAAHSSLQFSDMFKATVPASLLGHVVYVAVGLFCFSGVDDRSDAACKSKTAKRVGFWSSTAVLALGTAAAANVKGASWSRSLPGSAAGLVASALIGRLASDAGLQWVGVLASIPIHAGTTALLPVLWD